MLRCTQEIGKRCQVYAPDLRFHGDSDKPQWVSMMQMRPVQTGYSHGIRHHCCVLTCPADSTFDTNPFVAALLHHANQEVALAAGLPCTSSGSRPQRYAACAAARGQSRSQTVGGTRAVMCMQHQIVRLASLTIHSCRSQAEPASGEARF